MNLGKDIRALADRDPNAYLLDNELRKLNLLLKPALSKSDF